MSLIKFDKKDNSYTFEISKAELEAAGFDETSDYELTVEKDLILVVKKFSRASEWIFKNPALSETDIKWLESDLESKK